MPNNEPTPAPRRDRRGSALAAGAAMLLLFCSLYAGQAWAVVVDQLFFGDGPVLAAWLLAATGIGAALLRILLPADAPGFATTAALGLGVMSLAALGLGLAGWLNRPVAVALIVIGLALGGVEVIRRRESLESRVREWFRAPAGWGLLWLVLLPPLAIVLVGAILPPGMLWRPDEPHPYDVVEYHFQVPREWYELGRIVPLRHNVFSYFPFNVEMHYLLAMHLRGGPWRGMYLAQLMHAAHVVLTVIAVYGFARALAPKKSGAVIAGVVAASVPWLTLLAPIGYNEGGLLLYGTLAVGWAIRAIAAPERRLRTFVLAGLMAGFACGTKLTAVPMVLFAVPAALVVESLITRRLSLRSALAGAAVFVAAGTLACSPWLVRNVAWAGNPVFPEGMSLFGKAHFTDAQVERWKRAHAAPPSQSTAPARVAAFGTQVWGDWRFGYVLLPLSLVALLVARRHAPGWWLLLILLAELSVLWIAFTHLQGRFFVLAIPVAALLLARLDWGRWVAAGAIVAVAAALIGWWTVDSQLTPRLYGKQAWVGYLGVPGERFVQLHPPEVETMPPDATLTLVGDASAFWYPRPMATLRYRTVFDVDVLPGASVLDAWRGNRAPEPGEWQLVDPAELVRFSKTYWGIPAPPADVETRRDPYVIPPVQAGVATGTAAPVPDGSPAP